MCAGRLLTRTALVAVLLSFAIGRPAFSQQPVAPQQPLTHAGRWITDSSGRVIVLRGVNMVNKFPPYDLQSIGFGADDVAFLAQEGVNVVRVGVIYSAVEPSPGQYDDAYLDSIASTVALLNDAGIYSLLDFHQDSYGPVFNAEGLPAWATLTDGLPTGPLPLFPDVYTELPSLQHAFDNFWANQPGPDGIGLEDHYAAAWTHVAARFNDTPGVLGYDLFNEPFPGTPYLDCAGTDGCPDLDASLLTPFTAKMVAAVRQADGQHIIWYEPWVLFDGGAATHVGNLNDPLIGMSFHDYQPADDYRRPLENAEQQALRTGDALLMTEFGATEDPETISDILDASDNAMMSTIYWAYSNKTPFEIASPGGGTNNGEQQGLVLDPSKPLVPGNILESKWQAFVRPYPRAIAGTPEDWRYQPKTREFDLTYSTARADAAGRFADGSLTEIYVPKRQYPDCYDAEVSGGQVVSTANAAELWIVSDPGATDIAVQVRACRPANP